MYPTGTVTFLFTDIEGSTPLWEQMPAEMQSAVAQHHAILQQAIETHGGVVFQILGDAFQAAFRLASDASQAALAAQQALISAEWGQTGPLRVRMGLHTGPAEVEEREGPGKGEYATSHTLNRSARVMSAAYGGQILLSKETADMVERGLPEGVSLRDLGQHRLKGMQLPEHLYQLVAPGLPHDFPPLPTAIKHPNNLPYQATSFIGRETEISEALTLLGQHRLVTLTGAGGSGKTRLALESVPQLLDDYQHGIWLVELAPLSDPDLVIDTIAGVFHLHQAPGLSQEEQLASYLQAKRLLLVLDNCEHLLEACARWVDQILRTAPGVRILATSREPLGIAGEAVYPVPSLHLPEQADWDHMVQSESVRLFLNRAQVANPAFRPDERRAPALFRICTRLDGIPLALELAASRIRMMSVEQIAARLDDRFHLLTGGNRSALPRQQTLRAAIEWSDMLLTPHERSLFYRLSVFAGGWTLAAAEAVCPGVDQPGEEELAEGEVLDLLGSLVNKSLVLMEQSVPGEPRYRMLETIRQYAQEKLIESEEEPQIRAAHLVYFQTLAQEGEDQLRGPDLLIWKERLDAEIENIRSAIQWARQSGAVEPGLDLVSSVWVYWLMRGNWVEVKEWVASLLPAQTSSHQITTLLRARACLTAGQVATRLGEPAALSFLGESIACAKEAGTAGLRLLALAQSGLTMATLFISGDFAGARAIATEAIQAAQTSGDVWAIAASKNNLGLALISHGEYREGTTMLESSLTHANQTGDPRLIAAIKTNFGWVLGKQGEYQAASPYMEQGISLARQMGDSYIYLQGLLMFGEIELGNRNNERAFRLYQECHETWLDLGVHHGGSLIGMGRVQLFQGNLEEAQRLIEEGLRYTREFNKLDMLPGLIALARVQVRNEAYEQAGNLLQEAFDLLQHVGGPEFTADCLEIMAVVIAARGKYTNAAQMLGSAQALRETANVPMPPYQVEGYEQWIGFIRGRLDGEMWARELKRGRNLPAEQAIRKIREDTLI